MSRYNASPNLLFYWSLVRHWGLIRHWSLVRRWSHIQAARACPVGRVRICLIVLVASGLAFVPGYRAGAGGIEAQFANIVTGMGPFNVKRQDEIEQQAQTYRPQDDSRAVRAEEKPTPRQVPDDAAKADEEEPWRWYYERGADENWIFEENRPLTVRGDRQEAQEYARSRISALVQLVLRGMHWSGDDMYSYHVFISRLFALLPRTGIVTINVPAEHPAQGDQQMYLGLRQRWARLGYTRSYDPLFVKGSGTSENFRALLLAALDYYVFMLAGSLWTEEEEFVPDPNKIAELIRERPCFQPVILKPFYPGVEHHAVAWIQPDLFRSGAYARQDRSDMLESAVRIYDFWAAMDNPRENWANIPLEQWVKQIRPAFGPVQDGFRLASTAQAVYPLRLPAGPMALGPGSVNIMLGGFVFRPSWLADRAGPAEVLDAVTREEPEGFSGPVIMLFGRIDHIRNGHFLKKELFVDPRTNPYPERNILRRVLGAVDRYASEQVKNAVMPTIDAMWRRMAD